MTDQYEESDDGVEGFLAVCAVDEVPEHMPLKVEAFGRAVLLCRSDDGIYAVDEICPHENESMARGVVFEGQIICPHHQYRFDLDTGRCNRRCAPVQTYEVRVVEDEVWLRR